MYAPLFSVIKGETAELSLYGEWQRQFRLCSRDPNVYFKIFSFSENGNDFSSAGDMPISSTLNGIKNFQWAVHLIHLEVAPGVARVMHPLFRPTPPHSSQPLDRRKGTIQFRPIPRRLNSQSSRLSLNSKWGLD